MKFKFILCSEIAFELPSGPDFGCSRRCKTKPVDLEGSRGQVSVVWDGFWKLFCFLGAKSISHCGQRPATSMPQTRTPEPDFRSFLCGLSQVPPGSSWAGKLPKIDDFRSSHPPPPKKPVNSFDCIGVMVRTREPAGQTNNKNRPGRQRTRPGTLTATP